MKDKYRIGFVKLAIVVCALLLALVPAALAKCVDSDGTEHDDHKWGDWQTERDATCEKEGKQVRYCERCGEKDKRHTDALGHDWSDWSTEREPTCEDSGKRVKTCHRCGDRKEDKLDALGHDWSDWSTEKEPTCEDSGKRVKTCHRCGDKKEEKLDALGHSWSDWATEKEPTCDEAGVQARVCARCGKREEKKLDALGHQWSDWSTEKEPTCEEAGKRTRSCARCGKTEEEKLDALGHDYSSVKTDPTCEEAGTITYTCARCGKTYAEAGEAALGHDWGEWKQNEAADGAPATQTRACKRCGLEETETLEAPVEAEKTGAEPVTITFDMGYGTPVIITGEKGAAVDAAQIPGTSRDNYTFVKWDKAIPEIFDANLTVTAVWRPNIVDVAALEDVKVNTYKPALEDALKLLPTTVEATLADKSKVKATLVWNNASCPSYGDKADDASGNRAYLFTAVAIQAADGVGDDYFVNSDVKATCNFVVGTKTAGDYEYQLDADGRAVIAKYLGSASDLLEVPQKLEGHDVVAIGSEAFKGAAFTGVTLPLGVARIDARAFRDCANLAALEVPAGVGVIGDSAFANCPKLAALTLPDSLTDLAANAFTGDAALSQLTLSASLESRLDSASAYSRALLPGDAGYSDSQPDKRVSVNLPISVTDIAVYSPSATPFTLATALTVQSGHGVTVAAGAKLSVEANLTNLGSIDNAGDVTVQSGATLDNNAGSFANDGATEVYGRIITCAGEWSGSNARKHGDGSFVKDHDYELVKFDHYACKACGHTKKFSQKELTITFKGSTLYKTYDKTRNIQSSSQWLLNRKLTRSDFQVNAVKDSETGKTYKDVSISLSGATISKFSKADAGNYNLTLKVQLTGDDLEYYKLDKEGGKYYKTVTVPARIDKRRVTVTPKDMTYKLASGSTVTYKISKKYGESNKFIPFTYSGLLNLTAAETSAGAKLYTGQLSRQAGEDAGTYRIEMGTLDFGNKNYDVVLESQVFTITKKPISDTDIGMVTIGNQRYTGKAVEPAVTLRYGLKTLKEGADFKVEYKDNVSPGSNTAKVTITGIGNYTGTKTTSFSILNITSDFSTRTSGSGSYSYNGFDSGEFEDNTDGDEDGEGRTSENGGLVLDDEDYGSVLFDPMGEAQPFVLFEDKDELNPGKRTVTIIADPMVNELTGESLFLEDGIRERYDELHLRLDVSLAQKLMEKGVTEVVYELEQADLRIPLASLVEEIPMVGDASSEAVETPVDAPEAEEATEDEFVVEEADGAADEAVGEVGAPNETGVDPVAPTMKAQTYDFCIQQADATGLSEAEAEVLEEGDLMMPAYRASVRVVPEGAEKIPTGLTDEDGEPIEQYLNEPLPEGFYLQGLTLQLQPDGNLVTAPEGAHAIYMDTEAPEGDEAVGDVDDESDEDFDEDFEEAPDEDYDDESDEDFDDETDDEEIESVESVVTPVEFVSVDGALVVQLPLNADGLYAVRAPEDWNPEAYMADEGGDEGLFEGETDGFEDDEDFEEEGFDDEGFDDEFEELV